MLPVNQLTSDFIQIIDSFPEEIINLPEADLRIKPSATKWSKIEILGHLVDSGLNNHQRWIRVLQGEPMIINYNQDKWVALQNYQHMPVAEVLDLWILINKQLRRMIERMRAEDLNLPYNDGQKELSLGYLVKDYIYHLQHHIKQIKS